MSGIFGALALAGLHCSATIYRVGSEIGRISLSMGDSIIVRSQIYGSVLRPTAVLLLNDCPRVTPTQ